MRYIRPAGMTAMLRLLVPFLILTLAAGCVSRRRALAPDERPLPALSASRAELLDSLEERSRSIETMIATVNLTASGGAAGTGVLTTYRETKGFVIVERPSYIRMKGQAPLALATVFDMVSDGEVFRVSVPVQNKFIIGDTAIVTQAENAVLNLRPQHIMEAMFVDVRNYLDNPDVAVALEQAAEGRRSFYVFSFIDIGSAVPRLLEKIWIDRLDLGVVRKQLFAEEGAVETDVEYSGYQDLDGVSFPSDIFIQRPIEDYSLRMTFVDADINMELPANAFRLEAPSGAELIRVAESEAGALE